MSHPFSPIRLLLFFVALAIPVVFVIPYLKVNLLPPTSEQALQIHLYLPNTPPAGVERRVIAPLENALSGIRGLKNIRSVSQYGQGSVFLEFGPREDIGARRFEVSSLLRSIYPKLPEGATYPVISGGQGQANEYAAPSLVYTVEGAGDVATLHSRGEQFFRQLLNNVESVVDIQVLGGQKTQLLIEVEPQKLKAFGLRKYDIVRALQEQYQLNFPGSGRDGFQRTLFVRTGPDSLSIGAIENTLIARKSGFPLRLRQLAEVRQTPAPPTQYFRVNGRDALQVYLSLAPNRNKAYEALRVKEIIGKAAQAQTGLRIRLAEDRTEWVRRELQKNWFRAGASLFILLLLLLLTYRKWRLVLILVFCLLINLATTILASWFFKVEWHTYTLAGLSVAFGLMIDNAIVMLDSYRQRLSRRIFTALLGASLTTAAALLLIFLLPFEQRRDLLDFALIIVLSLCSSLLSVLFLVPAAYDLWVGKADTGLLRSSKIKRLRRIATGLKRYGAMIDLFSRRRIAFFLCWILLFGLPVFWIPEEIPALPRYLQWINSADFQRDWRPQLEFWLGGTLGFFVRNARLEPYYGRSEFTALYIQAELPHGQTPEQLHALMQPFERYLSRQKGIDVFTTQIGSGQYGSLEIRFSKEAEKTSYPLRLQAQVQDLAQQFSGVQWNIYGKGEGFRNNLFLENQARTRLLLRGYDYKELGRQAEKMGQLLAENMRVQKIELDENLEYFSRPLPELYLALDADRTAERGLRAGELLDDIQERTEAGFFMLQSEQESRALAVKIKDSERFDVHQLLNEPVFPQGGAPVKLRELGKMELRRSSSEIHRENRQYLRLVTFEFIGSYESADRLYRQIVRKMNREMPLGYSVGRESGSIMKAAGSQFYLLYVLLAIVFFICAVLFEHLRQPFYIILTVPCSFIGIFLVFGWGGFHFDQGGFAAFAMLGGLVVNASIYIVNDLNNARGRLSDPHTTLTHVLYRRSGTILLTVISSIGGFIPFLYEGSQTPFWFSLAAGTIGGLLMSLFAVFLVLPVLMWNKKQPA